MREALSPVQSRHCQPAGSVLFAYIPLVFRLCSACVPLVFRLCSACIPLVFPWVCPAPPPPHSRSAFCTAHTTALHYRDAAVPEKVTALLRRESPFSLARAGDAEPFLFPPTAVAQFGHK